MNTLKIKKIARYGMIAVLALSASACTLMGLDLQENDKHQIRILDPEIHMSALEFIQTPLEDTLRSFERFYDAVVYAGMEDEYTKEGRTFFVFNNYAILRYNSDGVTINSGCYFGRNKVPSLDENGQPILDDNGNPVMRAATAWSDYPVEHVRELLRAHIAEGEYSYVNLGPDNVATSSLSQVDSTQTIYLKIQNDRNSKLVVNDFPGTYRMLSARTANLKATNGYIHVFDNSLYDARVQ